MIKIFDCWCKECNEILLDQAIINDKFPHCEICGNRMTVYWGGGSSPGIIGQGDYIPEALRKRQRGRMEDAGIRKIEKPKKVPIK